MFDSNSCRICGYSISDPVCKGCYIRQIEILLEDLDLQRKIYNAILRKIKNKFPAEAMNITECMLCRNDNVIICRHCFSIILTNILRDFDFTEEVIENFGYSQMYEETSLERERLLITLDKF